MAEKYVKSIVLLNVEDYEQFDSLNPVLKKGCPVICTIPIGESQEIKAMMKIGDGVNQFRSLPWLSALSADVFDWALQETKPIYNASEIVEDESHKFITLQEKEKISNIFPSDSLPLENGIGDSGSSYKYAREDHVHPLQESVPGNAGTATKATKDSAGLNINQTYIKGLSVRGQIITYTKGNGSTGTIKTQDTTFPNVTGYSRPSMKSGWTLVGGGWYRTGDEVKVHMSVSKSSKISSDINNRDIICSGLPAPVYETNAPVYHVKSASTSLLGVVKPNSSGQLELAVCGTSIKNYACWFNFSYLAK